MSNISEIPTGSSTSTETLIPNPGDKNVNMSEIPTGSCTSTKTLIPNTGDQNVKHVRDTNE